MARKRIWDALAWISFVIVILYFLAKIMGIINSPEIIDITALVSAAYFIGRYAMKLDFVFRDVAFIKKNIRKINRMCPIFTESK